MEDGKTGSSQGNSDGTGFSADYVKTLRDEAAGWRTKFRELEGVQTVQTIEAELTKAGIKANPSWVTVADGQSVELAVSKFAEDYPHLKVQQEAASDKEDVLEVITAKIGVESVKPQSPKKTVTAPNAPGPKEMLRSRQLQEIKKDPAARKQLANHYRNLLRQVSNQPLE